MKKTIFIILSLFILLPNIVKSQDVTIIPIDPNNPPPSSFCKNKSGSISAYINNKEYPFSIPSFSGIARDYFSDKKIDEGDVVWRQMLGKTDLVIWEKNNNILRVLFKSPGNAKTDIYWWPAGETLDKAIYFSMINSATIDLDIFNWVLSQQYRLEIGPISVKNLCPGQTQDVGPKRGASSEAVNSCQDKWLDTPLMSTDEGKKLLEEEYKKLNDFWSQGSGHNLFEPGGGNIITQEEDRAMYENFFLYADLTSTNTDTYVKATDYSQQVETRVLATLESLGLARDKVSACGENLPSSIIAYIGTGYDIPAAATECFKAATAGVIQGGAEKMIRALSNETITSAMAKQLHAFTYLRKYIEYRQCLAAHDPSISETVKKEVENYNALNKLRNQQLAQAAAADKSAGWENQVLAKVVCWMRDGFISIFYYEAQLSAWFLRRNY